MAEGSHTLSLNLVHNVQLLIATIDYYTYGTGLET